jgi:hypothetical protein
MTEDEPRWDLIARLRAEIRRDLGGFVRARLDETVARLARELDHDDERDDERGACDPDAVRFLPPRDWTP